MSVLCEDPESLFYYRYYVPENYIRAKMAGSHSSPGGFSVTIFVDGSLRYETFSTAREATGFTEFQLNPSLNTADDMETLLGYFDWWLTGCGLSIEMDNGKPSYRCEFGIKNHPLFQVDELDKLCYDSFLQDTGHYARRFYLLLEDVAEMLSHSGIFLTVNSFTWDSSTAMVTNSVDF